MSNIITVSKVFIQPIICLVCAVFHGLLLHFLKSSKKLLGILAPVNAIARDNSGIRRVHALVAVVAAVVRVVHPPPSKRVVPDEVEISFAAGARIVALLRVIPMCAHALVRVTDAAHAVGTNVCVEGLATT